ncbi:MAG: exodeoxyribonuclease VII small subunit [Planctomycetales bacterium]|nr:exodeoxyribonuclease VII small subunit [Planctomycetales bacterium]
MAKKKDTPSETEAGERFEEVLAGLEKAVAELEKGDLGVDDALARYEEGVRHLRRCQEILKRAEQRVEQLLRESDGSLAAKPFEPPAASAVKSPKPEP